MNYKIGLLKPQTINFGQGATRTGSDAVEVQYCGMLDGEAYLHVCGGDPSGSGAAEGIGVVVVHLQFASGAVSGSDWTSDSNTLTFTEATTTGRSAFVSIGDISAKAGFVRFHSIGSGSFTFGVDLLGHLPRIDSASIAKYSGSIPA